MWLWFDLRVHNLAFLFRYTGMLEAVRVRREGYSYRPFFSDFVSSYRAVAYPFTEEVRTRMCILSFTKDLVEWSFYVLDSVSLSLSSHLSLCFPLFSSVSPFLFPPSLSSSSLHRMWSWPKQRVRSFWTRPDWLAGDWLGVESSYATSTNKNFSSFWSQWKMEQ